jgi:hypothetical protein
MTEKKYRIIAKIGNKPDGSAHCVRYRVNNLLTFTRFLDHKFSGWRWFNVYSKETGAQLGSFTNKRRPVSKYM